MNEAEPFSISLDLLYKLDRLITRMGEEHSDYLDEIEYEAVLISEMTGIFPRTIAIGCMLERLINQHGTGVEPDPAKFIWQALHHNLLTTPQASASKRN